MQMTSSLGNQEKWKVNGLWVKADSEGYEGLAESLASKFYSFWENKLPYVTYTEYLLNDGRKGCISENFLTDDQSILTLANILDKFDADVDKMCKNKSTLQQIEAVLSFLYLSVRVDASLYFAHQFSLDSFVMNEDRHLNNIIFLADRSTDRIVPGPLFDHGFAFASRMSQYPIWEDTKKTYQKIKAMPFSVDFDKQALAIQALTGYVPRISNEGLSMTFIPKSSIYKDEEVLRCLRLLRLRVSNSKIEWRGEE